MSFTVPVTTLVADVDSDYSLSNNIAAGTGTSSFVLRIKTTVAIDFSLKMKFRDLTLNPAATCSKNIIVLGVLTAIPLTGVVISGDTVTLSLTANPIPPSTTGEIFCTNLVQLPNIAKQSPLTQNLLC